MEVDETLVQRLMEKGEHMSLFKLLDYSVRIMMNGGKDPEFLKLFGELKSRAEEQWPGTIDWCGLPTFTDESYIKKGREIIPDPVKEAYIRCLLYTGGPKGM